MRTFFTYLILLSFIALTGAAYAQTITPDQTSINIGAGSGSTSVAVTADVSWTASANVAWLTPSNNGSDDAVLIDYDANPAITQRVGTITLTDGGSTTAQITVTQAGAAPSLLVSPSNQNVGSAASTTSFTVTANFDTWIPSESETWLSVNKNGNTVDVTFDENTTFSQRVGTITVSGEGQTQDVTVTQSGATASLNVTPSNRNVSSASGSVNFNVTANFTTWTPSESESWLSVTKNGTQITVNYDENTSIVQRVGTITVSGEGQTQDVTVTQAGSSASLSVSPSNQNVTSASGSTSFTVTANFDTWTPAESESWLSVTKNGNQVNVNYDENTSVAQRVGTITVSGEGQTQDVTVTQSGAATTLSVNPSDRPVTSAAGTTSFTITTNQPSWSFSTGAAWLTPSQNGTTLNVSYAENTAATQRIGTITITAGTSTQDVTVTQSGVTLDVTPATQIVAYTEGSVNYTVSSSGTWSSSDNAAWLVTSKPNSSTLAAAFMENTSADSRNATIAVTSGALSKNVTLTQNGAPANINMTPDNQPVAYQAGSTSYSVSANFSDWTVSKVGDWITSATKNGTTVNVSYQENPTVSQRVGKIVVSGRGVSDTVTVTQAAGPASVAVNPTSKTVTYPQGTAKFIVTANVTWSITEEVNWLTAGKNGDTLIVNYERNDAITSRQGIITITGSGVSPVAVTLTQQAAPPYITPEETAVSVGNGAGTRNVNVTSNVNWGVNESVDWITEASRTDGVLNIAYAQNLTVNERSGVINLTSSEGASSSVTVTQAAGLPFINLSTETLNPDYIAASLTVDVSANISWSVSESSDWITVSKIGDQIQVDVSENMTINPRSSTVTVTGGSITKQLTVNQAAGPERLAVVPQTQAVDYLEGDTSFNVDANVNWSVSESVSWFYAVKDNNNVIVLFNENTSVDPRSGIFTVTAGSLVQNVTVTQSGRPPILSVSPSNKNVGYEGATTTFSVSANFLNWTISENENWLSASVSGNTINVTYQTNSTIDVRVGQIIISGRGLSDTVTVTQNAGPSDLDIDPLSREVSYTSGTAVFNVTANVEWSINESVTWFNAVKSGSQINVTYQENSSTIARTATFTVTGGEITRTLTVTQDGTPEQITLDPGSVEVNYQAGSTSFDVSTNTSSWAASENVGWLEITKYNSYVNINYVENTSVNPRTGKITITAGDSSKVFQITQKGTPAAIAADSLTKHVGFTTGTVSFEIISNIDWTPSENVDWFTVLKSGNTLQVNYTKNNTRQQRQGVITLSGEGTSIDLTVVQQENLEVDVASLISPANNVYLSGYDMAFNWTIPTAADTCELEISDSLNFSNMVYKSAGLTVPVDTVAELFEGVKYFWRVRAYNRYGLSSYSPVRSFTTKLAKPEGLTISQNSFNEINLIWQDKSKNEDGYMILRSFRDGAFALIDSVPSNQINYIDASITTTGKYTYRVYAYNEFSKSDTVEIYINAISIANEDVDANVPKEYSLSEAYPNPFNPSAKIRYALPELSDVRIEIFNILGERVDVLYEGQANAGYHEARWNAYNMPSGIYIIRTVAQSLVSDKKFVGVKKAMLLK